MGLAKDAFYFPHFSNARHDRKMRRVRKELGLEGYAIYFMILEVLRDQPDFKYPSQDIDLLADEFGTSEQKIQVVVNNYGLFLTDESNNFYSPKFYEYMKPYLERSERARQAALKRWNDEQQSDSNANASANAERGQSDSNASKGKERKVKENKKTTTVENDKIIFDQSSASFKNITDPIIGKWKETFPAIDVEQEIKKAESWLDANPKNKKKNYKRFLHNWLTKAQEKAPKLQRNKSSPDDSWKDSNDNIVNLPKGANT